MTQSTTSQRVRPAPARRPGRGTRPRGRAPWRVIAGWLDRPLSSFHLTVAIFALMLGYGLLMVLSSSTATAFRRSDSAFAVFTSQALFAGLGLIAFVIMMRMPLGLIRSVSTAFIVVSLALLVLVLVPGIGTTYYGAQSWITLGPRLQFQPSELAKFALLLWSAHVLASSRSPYRRLKTLLIPAGPVFALMVLLIMLQPDLGTTVTLAIVFFSVLYFAGAQWWIFGGIALLGMLGMAYLATSAGYRMARVNAWLHPDIADPASTYQSFQGLYAMGSGGLWGAGLGESKMKWGRLPNADSDFIFAIIGEELGLIGTLTVVVLFALLAYTGLRIARRNIDPFIRIVAAAGTLWLVGQATINIGYVVGLLPVTGIPLPMFSAGGTSLVVTMMVFGLLANFARREPQAVAALHGTEPHGVAAFLGIGAGRGSRVATAAKPPSKRALRRRRQRQAQRAARAQRDAGTARGGPTRRSGTSPRTVTPRPGAGRSRAPAPSARRTDGASSTGHRQRSPRGGTAGPLRRRRQRRYRLRRALGFPLPGQHPTATGPRRVAARADRVVRR